MLMLGVWRYCMASLAWVAWSLPSLSCCCCSRVDMLLSCSLGKGVRGGEGWQEGEVVAGAQLQCAAHVSRHLICSSTVTTAPSGGSGGATTSAMLHTRCFSPFFAHDGVSEAAAEPDKL